MKESDLAAWKGADLVSSTKTLVDPYGNALVSVLVGPEVIPSTNVAEIEELDSSTRSRNIQLHLEMGEGTPRMIAGQVASRGLEGQELTYQVPLVIPVRNYSPRYIEIPGKTPIGRLYRTGEKIQGEELHELFNSHEIDANGLILRYVNDPKKRRRNLIGATLPLESIMRKGILAKRKKSENRLNLGDFQGPEYREKIDRELEELDARRTVLWIGNTGMKLKLPHGVDAILGRGVYLNAALRDASSYVGEHINSRLLDGGRDWVIRVEVWGKAIRGLVTNYIDVDFFRGVDKPKTVDINKN